MFKRIKINDNERGFVFERGVLVRVLKGGIHWMFDPWFEKTVSVVSTDEAELAHPQIEAIVKSGLIAGEAEILDVLDHERALVWVDKRFEEIVEPGVAVFWNINHDIAVEIVDARTTRFVHPDLKAIIATGGSQLTVTEVPAGWVGLRYEDGVLAETMKPGRYATWNGLVKTTVQYVDMREQVLDIASQEIMTLDKVTLRMNAIVTFVVEDAVKAHESVGDFRQTLYRDAQLALRAVVGTLALDELLTNKDAVIETLEKDVRAKASAFGVRVSAFGIKDVILPGEMKTLMNRVTEAKKAAEASLITRREETAAMRSQANTAKILDANPTLMRLKELEVLEKVAEKSSLTVVLGENGLSDRLTKLL